jgi:hypothetical protein
MDVIQRRVRYSKVSTALAHCDDAALSDLLELGSHPGQGTTQTIDIAGEKVLLKAIPLTDLERERGFSTRNHYELPPYYQYGVGSAGFGAWRELVASLTVSNWVLEGAVDAFALLYHWRVIPQPRRTPSESVQPLDEYVRSWNSSTAIGRYVQDRQAASHLVLLFFEWFPLSLWTHLKDRPDDNEPIVNRICGTVSFLQERGIFHFDAHFSNVVTDGERPHLVDFGLAVDERFDLSSAERAFLRRHRHYDYGEVISSIGSLMVPWYEALTEAERVAVRARLDAPDDPAAVHQALVRKIERLAGLAHPALVNAVVRYRAIIEYMGRFFRDQRANEHKDTPYDDELLRRLLTASGAIR